PGLRVPGCWDGFELAACEVLGHRAGEVVKALGRPCSFGGLTRLFPTREVLAQADLRAIGVPHDRAEAVQALARAFSSGRVSFAVESEAAVDDLRRFRGVPPATAEWVALRAMGEPDAFPSGDPGLVRAAGLRAPAEMERLAQAWRPWRAYAAICLRNFASAAGHRRGGRKPAPPGGSPPHAHTPLHSANTGPPRALCGPP